MNYMFCVSVILMICIVESWLSDDIDNTELFILFSEEIGINMVEGSLFC